MGWQWHGSVDGNGSCCDFLLRPTKEWGKIQEMRVQLVKKVAVAKVLLHIQHLSLICTVPTCRIHELFSPESSQGRVVVFPELERKEQICRLSPPLNGKSGICVGRSFLVYS
jgi:hypothetical protein